MAKVEKEKITFAKEQLLDSKKYSHRKDILQVLLKDNQQYTFEQVDNLINGFLKRKVK
jgi:hypothetical protein